MVLQRLEQVGLTVNEAKCEFRKNELDFFGLHFSKNGISVETTKREALLNATKPQSQSEVRSLLGLANYCMRFISDLATIAKPLRDLIKQKAKCVWTHEHDHALNKLKLALTTTSMAYFDPKLRSEVSVDASPVDQRRAHSGSRCGGGCLWPVQQPQDGQHHGWIGPH